MLDLRRADPGEGGEKVELREDLFTKQDGYWETFICRCDPKGTAEAEELRVLVMEKLAADGREVTDRDFLTHVIISLNWDYGAHITSIANDMWSHVIAETWLETEKELKVRAQCDDVEDGIAAVWYAFWLRKNGTDLRTRD